MGAEDREQPRLLGDLIRRIEALEAEVDKLREWRRTRVAQDAAAAVRRAGRPRGDDH